MTAFAELARRTARFAINKSPAILTSVAVVGSITTAYFAGKASFEAADIIRLKEGEDEARGIRLGTPNEVMKQRLELVWRLYVPTMLMGTATVVCIIGANRVGARRAAGLAAAATITERALEQYKAKVVETIGERKEQQISDAVIQDRVNATYNDDLVIYGDSEGELCVDKFSGHFFRSTREKIHSHINDFNYMLNRNGYGSLADLYEFFGLPSIEYADQLGWDLNSEGLLEVKIDAAVAPGGKPCLTMEFKGRPRPNLDRFR